MHNMLIAAFFVAIVLSPCLAALWNRTDPLLQQPRAPKKIKTKRVEEIVDEIEDPWTAGAAQRRAVLLKCVRSSQLRHLHSHEVGTSGTTLRESAVSRR
jgi:hypothetical protein